MNGSTILKCGFPKTKSISVPRIIIKINWKSLPQYRIQISIVTNWKTKRLHFHSSSPPISKRIKDKYKDYLFVSIRH